LNQSRGEEASLERSLVMHSLSPSPRSAPATPSVAAPASIASKLDGTLSSGSDGGGGGGGDGGDGGDGDSSVRGGTPQHLQLALQLEQSAVTSSDAGGVAGSTPTASTLVPVTLVTEAVTAASLGPCDGAEAAAAAAAAGAARREATLRLVEQRSAQRRWWTQRLVLHAWCGASRNTRILRNMSALASRVAPRAAATAAAAAAAAYDSPGRPVSLAGESSQPVATPPPPAAEHQAESPAMPEAGGAATGVQGDQGDGSLGTLFYEKLAAARAAQHRAEEAGAHAAREGHAHAEAVRAALGGELRRAEVELRAAREAVRDERRGQGEALQDVAAALAAAHSVVQHRIDHSCG
jgi:hypothetical protein